MSERVTSETHAKWLSETPQTINLADYVTKEEFEHQILIREQEIVSLKERLRLTEVQLAKTQYVVSSIQEKLVALSAPTTISEKDNPTEGEKKAQEKDQAIEGKRKEMITTEG